MDYVRELGNTIVRTQRHVVSTMNEYLREIRQEHESESLRLSVEGRVKTIAYLRFACNSPSTI